MIIALENLAPVYRSPDALSFTPLILRTMAKRISSPAVGLCLDVGHANIVAGLRRTDPLELIEPALDRAVLFHLHDNLGARRGDAGSPELDPLRLDLHLPPGRGDLPWRRLAPLLARKRGAPLVLEVHPPRPSAAHQCAAPTATVAAMGAADLTAAAAAGMVTGASTVLAVLLYAGACWTWAHQNSVADDEEQQPAEVILLPVGRAAAPSELDLAA